jgi:hypothetical protein
LQRAGVDQRKPVDELAKLTFDGLRCDVRGNPGEY